MEPAPDAKLAQYAHPERLVTTGWLAERLGSPGLVVLESEEDVLLYGDKNNWWPVVDRTDDRSADLPEQLGAIVEDFLAMPERQRLELLLEFSRELPALPDRLAADRAALEPVVECQSPLFLLVEVDEPGRADSPVRLHFDAPAEAPTTRGFASILFAGLDGLPAREVVAVPDDVPQRLGLAKAVSPLRLTGMAGMLTRIKRQTRAKAGLA
jgi:cysteine desulfuration protein SufE